MPARKYQLPNIGDKIDDMIVTNIYHDKNNNVRIKMICSKCGRKNDANFVHGIVTHHCTLHYKICGKSRIKGNGLASKNVRFHRIWQNMRRRTTKKNDCRYKYYGGRGINSDAFKYFVDFYDAMFDKYQKAIKKYGDEKIISLDRINPDGNYCPENCRFISTKEQQKNKCRNKWFLAISPQGNKYFCCNKTELSRIENIKYVTINNSLLYKYKNRQGWTFRYLTEQEIADNNLYDRLNSVIKIK